MAWTLLVWLITAAVAGMLGGAAVQHLRLPLRSLLGKVGCALCSGYGILCLGLACLGFLNHLTTPAIASWLAVAGALGLAKGVRFWSTLPYRAAGPWAIPYALTLLLVLPRALGPETEGDALCYHLELPKQFLSHGSLVFLPWTDQSLFPLLANLWYAVGLAFDAPSLGRVTALLWALALAGAAVELASQVGFPRLGPLAGLFVLTAPVITNHASVSYVDLPTAMFGAWGLVLALGAKTGRSAAAAGLHLGFAASSKLSGVGWGLAVGVGLLTSRPWRGLLPAAAVAAAVALPWYLRAYQHTGNPTYPYFASLFPQSKRPYDQRAPKELPVRVGTPKVVLLPVLATFAPERFGGRGQQWGAVFLALAPAALWFRRGCSRRSRFVVVSVACYAVLWALFKQNLRFLLPALPSLAVWAAAGASVLWNSMTVAGRMAVVSAVGLHLAVGWAVAARRSLPYLPLLTGATSPQAFLESREPTYVLAQRLERALQADSVILTPEHRLFYFNRLVVREDALRRWLGYECQGRNLLACLRYLGITHVLLPESHNVEVAAYDTWLADSLRSVLRPTDLTFEHSFRGPGGDHRVYRLYRLPPGPRAPCCEPREPERWEAVREGLRRYRPGNG